MAGHAHVRHRVGTGLVLATVACVATSLPGVLAADSAAAAPVGSAGQPSVADVQREIASLGRQLDAVTEQYNGVTVRLAEARRTEDAARAAERSIDAQVERNSGEVRMLASSTYRAGPLSRLVSMVSSGSPQEFLDRMSMLDTLSRRQHRMLDDLRASQARAAAAARNAHRSTAAVQHLAAELEAKKSWISQRLSKQQALLASLTAEQRQQALNPDGRSTSSLPVTPAPASGRAAIAVAAAMSKLGSPYVWAAAGPDTFDCSGLMLWAWAQAGVTLPHYTGDQYAMGTHVSRDQLQPGDLVFFYPDISHVGMYIGGGNIIHAPQPGDVVKISSIDSFPYAGATRVG